MNYDKKKIRGYCFAVLLSLSLMTVAVADSVTYATASGGISNLVNVPILVNQLILSSSASTNTTVYLIDSKTTALTFTNNIYYTISSTVGNVTNVYTNVLGTIQTNVYLGQQLTTVTNAASTNNLSVVATLIVPAASTITYTPANFYRFMNGLLVTNVNGVTASFSYSRW
jgi:hypothetical protein